MTTSNITADNRELIDYSRLPEGLREGMRRYIERGVPTGRFLRLFLSNDLMGAMGHADDLNRYAFWPIAVFLFNEAPAACYGSPEKVKAWIEQGGLSGRPIGETL